MNCVYEVLSKNNIEIKIIKNNDEYNTVYDNINTTNDILLVLMVGSTIQFFNRSKFENIVVLLKWGKLNSILPDSPVLIDLWTIPLGYITAVIPILADLPIKIPSSTER